MARVARILTMRSSHFALIGVVLLLGGCAGPTADEAPAAALAADDPGARFHGA